MTRRGIALVLSAPSGAGKSTLCSMLLREFPNLGYSVSCTTRAMRDGETDGKDYHFISREEFLRRRSVGYFAEWAQVHDNLYGTPLAPLRDLLRSGRDVLFDIDVQGAAQLRLNLPEASFAFILPPSMAELEKRLRGRNLDDQNSIMRRLGNAAAEMKSAFWYDALIFNDNLQKAYEDLRSFYIASTLKPAQNAAMLAMLLEGPTNQA